MDPFTIHCSSCQSRIRVRNPNMIGQIANCPKCGSMIMIAAPQAGAGAQQQILVDSPTGSVTDSVAVTKEALPVPGESLLGELRLQPLEQGFEPAFRSQNLAESITAEPIALDTLSPANWMPEPTPPPRIDETVPNDSSPSNSRQIMLVAAIGLCSVLLACGMFFVFLRWYARPATIAKNPTSAGQTTGITPALSTTADAAESLGATSQPERAAPDQSAALTNATAAAVQPEQPAEDTSAPTPENAIAAELAAGQPGTKVPPASGSATNDSQTNAVAASGAPLTSIANAAPGSGDAASGSPLDLQHMPDIDATFAGPEAEANGQAIKEALPPGLQNFASIFDQALVPVLSDATVPLAAAPDGGDDQTHTPEAAAAAPMSFMLPETLEKKQTATIAGLSIQDRPLAEVLSTLSLTSDIPVTVDLDALMAAGVDRDQTIKFKSATPVTVLDVIGALARDYHLSFEPYEKKLFIVRGASDVVESRVPASLPIADLVSEADQSAALSAALSELLPELGDGFQLADGAAQADLDKVNRLLWFQVARLLQSWRAARGIDNADSAALVPKSSLLPAWPDDAAHKLAQKKISQTLLPEPLALGWHRLASEAGMTCWIDWPSLLSAQASPGQIGMTISRGRPLHELLQHDSDKYQVIFALEDEHTLWVTSRDMHRFQPRLYVLPMAGKTIEEWRKELEPLTPFNPDGSEALKVIGAPDGRFVFIRCCRPVLAEPQF